MAIKNWPWKSKVKVMCEVTVLSHNLSQTSYWLTYFWFHINPPSYCYDRTFLNLTFKIQGQSHSSRTQSWYILSTHFPFVPCWSALPFLRYSYFKIWPWKYKDKIMGEDKVSRHYVSLASYQLTSLWFHVNWPSHFWHAAFSKFDLENPRSRS